jgi:hypothetical protein
LLLSVGVGSLESTGLPIAPGLDKLPRYSTQAAIKKRGSEGQSATVPENCPLNQSREKDNSLKSAKF